MTITNALWNTGVETSSTAWDGWCGRHPMPSISFTPLSIALTVIHHRNASIPKCTLRTGRGIQWYGEILEDDIVPIDVKSTLRVGNTLVPLIIMSDGTHLSNFAGDKTEWPVYMTIGNLSSKIHHRPSTDRVVIVALLPIPIMYHNIHQKRQDEQQQTNWEVLNGVHWRVLQPLTLKQIRCADSGYYNLLRADRNFRRCKLVLVAWLAHCAEYTDLHHLEWHLCFWSECPKNEHGVCVPLDKQHHRRYRNPYR